MAFEPLRHSEKLFNPLVGKVVEITLNLNGRLYNYTGKLQGVNEHFLLMRNRKGRLRIFSISAIVKIVEVETNA